MTVTVKLDAERVASGYSARYQAAQKYLDNEVLKDCDPYVPMDTGNLRNSGIRGTQIGSGQIIYNAPYARQCYYAKNIQFSPAKHPNATAFWFEKAKAANKDKWMSAVNKTIKG